MRETISEPAQHIDTRIRIITPENIAFQYHIAGPFQRLTAYFVDLVLRGTMILVAILLFSFFFGVAGLPGVGSALGLLMYFLIAWFYGGLFETFWNGQTPGKRLMRLRVLSANGQPINALQAILRNILRAVDMLPCCYGLAFVSAFFNDRFARLGDLACGTMVIVEEPKISYGVIKVVEPEVTALASTLPQRIIVSRSLALALSGYVARRRQLAWARRVQVARYIAEPLREKYGLPDGTSYDLLLCAIYQKVFFSDVVDQTPAAAAGGSPFMAAAKG